MFQFHKGAIKTLRDRATSIRYGCFNSIKVRLKRFLNFESLWLLTRFNSIKVRLKLVGVAFYLVEKQFQFHKGAIKTRAGDCRESAPTAFQFHKGAIKTVR